MTTRPGADVRARGPGLTAAGAGRRLARPAPRPTGETTPPAIELPETPRRGRMAWLVLLGCVLAATPPLLIELGRPAVTDPREARTLATAWDSLREQSRLRDAGTHPASLEFWTPHLNGEAQWDRPPAAAAWHALALSPGADSAKLPPDLWRVRLVSTIAALLAVAAVFWAGYSLGGMAAGGLAALVLASTPAFVLQGRLATAGIVTLAWSTLAIASALWAMRPLRPAAPIVRQATGWALAGVSVGLTLLTGGPAATALLVGPMFILVVVCPKRISHLLGLVAALVVATLMALPWAGQALSADLDAWRSWIAELVPAAWGEHGDPATRIGGRLAALLLVTLPWTGWGLAALVEPFSSSSKGARRRLFLGWAWVVTLLVLLMAMPSLSNLAELIVLLPAAAVTIGQLFGVLMECSAAGRHARLWRGLRWPYLAAAAAAAVLIPTAFALQPVLIESGWLAASFSAEMGWPYWIGLCIVLLAGVVLTFRWASHHYPGLTLLGWSAWMIVLMTAVAIPLARGPLHRSPATAEAQQLAMLVGDAPLYWLEVEPNGDEGVDPMLLLHLHRRVPRLAAEQIEAALADHGAIYVLAPGGAAVATDARGQMVGGLATLQRSVWRYTAAQSDVVTNPP